MGCLLFPMVVAIFCIWLSFYVAVFALALMVWDLGDPRRLAGNRSSAANATGHRWDPSLSPFGPLAMKRATREFRAKVLKRSPSEPEREVFRWQHSSGAVLVGLSAAG